MANIIIEIQIVELSSLLIKGCSTFNCLE